MAKRGTGRREKSLEAWHNSAGTVPGGEGGRKGFKAQRMKALLECGGEPSMSPRLLVTLMFWSQGVKAEVFPGNPGNLKFYVHPRERLHITDKVCPKNLNLKFKCKRLKGLCSSPLLPATIPTSGTDHMWGLIVSGEESRVEGEVCVFMYLISLLSLFFLSYLNSSDEVCGCERHCSSSMLFFRLEDFRFFVYPLEEIYLPWG